MSVMNLLVRMVIFLFSDTCKRHHTFLTLPEAFLAYKKGLHKFIDHRNGAFPKRFQLYELELNSGRGLWSTDPPKVMSDVTEALIGAAHLDRGYDGGQKAALHVAQPLMQSLSTLFCNDSNEFLGLLHPKQHLYEMTRGIISVKVHKRDTYQYKKLLSFAVHISDDGCDSGYIGVVRCKNILLVAVVEASRNRAMNIACELAIQVLKENPSITAQLQDLNETNLSCSV